MTTGVDWESMPTVTMAEELVERHRRLMVSEAEFLRGLALFDRRLGWQVMGYRSAAAWLARTMGMTMVTAREKLRVARVLADGLPGVGLAFAEGRISYSAARTLCALPDADPDTEATLIRAAEKGVAVSELASLVRGVRDAIDPDGSNGEAMDRFDQRGLHYTRGMAGGVLGNFELDAEDGDLLIAAIDSVLAGEKANGYPVIPSPVDSQESTAEPASPPQRRVLSLPPLSTTRRMAALQATRRAWSAVCPVVAVLGPT